MIVLRWRPILKELARRAAGPACRKHETSREDSDACCRWCAHFAEHIGYRRCVTSVQTLLVLILIPAGIYCLFALLTLWPKFVRPRYRTGQEWNFAPVFWVANPQNLGSGASSMELPTDPEEQARSTVARGGARGNW